MFRAFSRRTSAYAPILLPTQRQSATRSIHTNTTRPTLPRPGHASNALRTRHLPTSRPLSFAQRVRLGYREASKGIFRKNPVLFPLAIVSAVGAILTFAYISYVEVTQVQPQYHNFPPPVTKALRTAVYYTEMDLNPAKALKSYKEALRLAVELGMHPFSDEVLGIKLQVAMMLEKAGLAKPAVDVLERTKAETLKWIEEGRVAEARGLGAAVKRENLPVQVNAAPESVQVNEGSGPVQEAAQEMREMQAFEARQRDKALKKVVGMQMKLAELYGSDYIQEDKKAEEAQVAAVELCLKEMHRRQRLGLPVGGGTGKGTDEDSDRWLNLTELSTALVELASTYTTKDRHELAMPLYLRALDMIRVAEGDSPSCKQVTLLNDVASAMAGQVQSPSPRTKQQQQQQGIPPEQTVEAARQWAQKSLDVAARIQPPVRDEECDLTCVAATYNLGELAELQNKPDVAKQCYTEAQSLAKALGYEDGVAMADAALKRLRKK